MIPLRIVPNTRDGAYTIPSWALAQAISARSLKEDERRRRLKLTLKRWDLWNARENEKSKQEMAATWKEKA